VALIQKQVSFPPGVGKKKMAQGKRKGGKPILRPRKKVNSLVRGKKGKGIVKNWGRGQFGILGLGGTLKKR